MNPNLMLKIPSSNLKTGRDVGYGFLLLLAALLSLLHAVGVNHQSFWTDEACSYMTVSGRSFSDLVDYLTHVIHSDRLSQSYFVILWLFQQVSDSGILCYRFLSVAAFWVMAWVSFMGLRNRFGKKTAAWGILILAVHPFLWQYSQEARSYMFALMCLCGCIWAVTSPSPAGRSGWWRDLVLIVCFGIGALANTYILTSLPALLFADYQSRRLLSLRRLGTIWLSLGIITILVSWQYLVVASGGAPGPGGEQRPDLVRLLGSLHACLFGLSWGIPVSKVRGAASLGMLLREYALEYALSVLMAGWFLFGVLRYRLWKLVAVELLVAAGSFLTLVGLMFWSGYPPAPRHYFLCLPFIIASTGLMAARSRFFGLAFVGVLMASSAQYLFVSDYSRENWREALMVLSQYTAKGTPKVVFQTTTDHMLDVYPLSNSIHVWPGRWQQDSHPNFLVEARLWELNEMERREFLKQCSHMKKLYETHGVTIWRTDLPHSPRSATTNGDPEQERYPPN